MNENEKVVDLFVGVLKDSFDEAQKEPFQYVVEYRNVHDDSLIGYHLSSWCQVSQNRLDAKRYNGENAFKQLGIINKNLAHILSTTEESTGMFSPMFINIRNTYFPGLKIEDIYLQPDYLEDDCVKQKFVCHKAE